MSIYYLSNFNICKSLIWCCLLCDGTWSVSCCYNKACSTNFPKFIRRDLV